MADCEYCHEDLDDYTKPLAPCPFCGAKWNRLFVVENEIGLFYVECSTNDYGCGSTGPAAISEADAIEKWNRRADNGNG